jgi:hypothetical protein
MQKLATTRVPGRAEIDITKRARRVPDHIKIGLVRWSEAETLTRLSQGSSLGQGILMAERDK